MFKVNRQTLINRVTGKTKSRKKEQVNRHRLTPVEKDIIEDMALEMYSWGVAFDRGES